MEHRIRGKNNANLCKKRIFTFFRLPSLRIFKVGGTSIIFKLRWEGEPIYFGRAPMLRLYRIIPQ
jgi:hypothetical protein